MSARYLRVVQLDVAKSYRRYRGDIDDVIAILTPDLRRAAAGKIVPVDLPTTSGGTLQVTVANGAMMASLMIHGVPVATWSVARRATAAPRLWSIMTDYRPTQAERPAWPWVAWRIEQSAPLVVGAEADWLVDYMCCTAWTWIEMTAND